MRPLLDPEEELAREGSSHLLLTKAEPCSVKRPTSQMRACHGRSVLGGTRGLEGEAGGK